MRSGAGCLVVIAVAIFVVLLLYGLLAFFTWLICTGFGWQWNWLTPLAVEALICLVTYAANRIKNGA